ncbi:MAG: phosphatase PAP2 family protein [Lactobacillus helsingborgensis]|uniref:phosphatase PAP2 family protein n=1 Tax=Lactobacillus TaxID=1578 RepID=UPI000D6FC404|nr:MULTISPECIES: phosphatase PAP2 family protein [Lactobacillus]AWN33731.1 phospholipid phosphatase [Lactobacillus helsingborgensis]MBC6355796.1 phosphatase PAP2 family protein [Lactobacillus helsingborgensis]MCT6827275.1 phosphatase PAP2 family protein [Lactobacillus helsingborgensis]MCT6847675.1 phosphatase PAP2 family protein [Lactobacillus helsingborgensis]RMC53188.1 phosphatase PAP2 family protein [Lactobacillus sp. ESL0262]
MNKTIQTKRDTIIPATIFLILYAAWAILVASENQFIHEFDRTVINIICNNNPILIKFATVFTNLGNTNVIMVETILLVIVLALFKKFAYAFFTAGTMIAANGYNWIIKHAIARHRPFTHHLVAAHGYSFPSGHSVGSATLFGILIVLTILLIKNKAAKTVLCIVWACFPILIGYTRIFSHVHYPSDVVGGFLEGIAFLLIGYSFLYHYYLEMRAQENSLV